jgi:hypothetical protein
MMGSKFYQIKIGLYVFVILMVGTLFAVRVHNTWQRTNYVTETIFESGDVQIALSYPDKILSARNEASYPLTLAFNYTGDTTSPHTYEISLQSPTLLFVDAKGLEVTPRFQFTSDHAFLERSLYVRPYLSEFYPDRHVIDIQVIVDGQETQNLPAPIEIQTESWLFSFFSLAAASLVEISVATALITWIFNAIDESSTARKEQVAQIREALSGLSSLSYLEQMNKVYKLEDEIKNENLDDDVGDEIGRLRSQFKEEEFFRALGEQLRQSKDGAIDSKTIQKLHSHFFVESKHTEYIGRLVEIPESEKNLKSDALFVISSLMKLWDEFDVSTKDLIIGALKRFLRKVDLSSISATELLTQFFTNNNRRRILRNAEMRALFPQLDFLPLVGYDARWLHLPRRPDHPRVLNWLKQHNLIANPFGSNDIKNYPFYPEGFARPDQWEDFLEAFPQHAQCPSLEDARALAFLLRVECLSARKVDTRGIEAASSGRQVFPVWVSLEQTAPVESPLVTLARSTARAWMDVLPFSPDAMLDLLPAEQEAVLEMLCWAFGSNGGVMDLLKRAGLKKDIAGSVFLHKVEGFRNRFSSTHLPQDAVILSWLRIRPPDLRHTFLILPLDDFSLPVRSWWLEQFSVLVPTLFLNGIVTKAFSSSHAPVALPLSTIQLNWSNSRLKTSLNAQFDAAMDKGKQREGGQVVNFRSLFGFDSTIGYFETEEETTDKLISASHNSLARMLMIGNHLLEKHCEQEVPMPHLSLAELKAILNIA